MSTAGWIILAFVTILNVGGSWSYFLLAEKREREARIREAYVRQANADFREAFALLQYGAAREAIELLSKYDREDA